MAMLEIRNVQKTFRTYAKPGLFHRPGARKVASELPVLRGVDLTVEKGDVVAILGPSGSGKTTLLRCLNFLETADSGTLVFDGESFDLGRISRADIARLRKKTAFVFQNYNLLPKTTAVENVELPLMYNPSYSAADRHKKAVESLVAVGLGVEQGAAGDALRGLDELVIGGLVLFLGAAEIGDAFDQLCHGCFPPSIYFVSSFCSDRRAAPVHFCSALPLYRGPTGE